MKKLMLVTVAAALVTTGALYASYSWVTRRQGVMAAGAPRLSRAEAP